MSNATLPGDDPTPPPSPARSAATAAPLLTADQLHKRYHMGGQSLHVLRGVDLQVHRGQWVAILGASGSGKSTLLHLLGGLDRPDQGRVVFDGHPVFTAGARAIDQYRNRRVGFVFQFYHLLPEMNVLENTLVPAMIGRSLPAWLRARAALRRRAKQLLDQLGLSPRLRHRPAKLSGGERQRVAIARALINQPDLLLADEPTGNLDADTGRQILGVLQQLHDQGQTIVMVTHDHRIAESADQTLTLHSGCLKGS